MSGAASNRAGIVNPAQQTNNGEDQESYQGNYQTEYGGFDNTPPAHPPPQTAAVENGFSAPVPQEAQTVPAPARTPPTEEEEEESE